MRTYLVTLLTVAATAAALAAKACAAPVEATTATVLRVVDRDFVDGVDDARRRLRVRVLGIFPVKSEYVDIETFARSN